MGVMARKPTLVKSTSPAVSNAVSAKPAKPVEVQRKNNGTFAPGNKLGFQPGQSGYPKGRPKGIRYISESLKLALVAIGKDGRSVADAIADAVIGKALEGDMKAVEFIAARTDKLSYAGGRAGAVAHFDEPGHVIEHEEEVYNVMEENECDRKRALEIIDEREAEEEREREKDARQRLHASRPVQIRAAVRLAYVSEE